MVVVKKKDGSNCICVDYRKLNWIAITDPEPMSTAEELFQKHGQCQFFSKRVLSKGYWQIPVADDDIHKTAFVAGDGCWKFVRMQFGMKNSGATLVRWMRKLLLHLEHVESYIDDLIIYTKDWDTHLQVLDEIFRRFPPAHLVVRLTKCLFSSKSVEFLSHLVGGNSITINEKNLEKIRHAKRFITKKEELGLQITTAITFHHLQQLRHRWVSWEGKDYRSVCNGMIHREGFRSATWESAS